MTENEYRSPIENPYAVPASIHIDAQSNPDKTAEVKLLRAFVGSNSKYYLEKWRPFVEHKGGSVGFNLAAFLLSGLWLPYRKMYFATTIFFAIILVESIAEEILFVGILGKEETPAALGRIVGLVASVICGMYGNRWYLSHARKVISDVHAQGLEGYAVSKALSKRGGTSIASSLGFLFLFIVISFAAFVVLELLFFSAEGLNQANNKPESDQRLIGNWAVNSHNSILAGIEVYTLDADGTGYHRSYLRRGKKLGEAFVQKLEWSSMLNELELSVHALVFDTDREKEALAKAMAIPKSYQILECTSDQIRFADTEDIWLKIDSVEFDSVANKWESIRVERFPRIGFPDE